MPILASPRKIRRTGEWGAAIQLPPSKIEPGEEIVIKTKAGKTWTGYVLTFEAGGPDWCIVTYEREPLTEGQLEWSAESRARFVKEDRHEGRSEERDESRDEPVDTPDHPRLVLKGDRVWLYNPVRNPDLSPLLRGLLGARWHSDEMAWSFSANPVDRDRIIAVATAAGAIIDQRVYEYRVPERVLEAVMRAERNGAYDFQLEGVRFFAWRDICLTADEQGVGKTFQSLQALPERARAIVVCPKSLKYNWAAEIEKWRPEFTPIIVKKRGTLRAPKEGEIMIINYDILPEKPPSGLKNTYLIADEGQKFKNRRTKTWKNMKALIEATGRAWVMTGTPFTNKPTDLWNILSAMGKEREVFTSWDKFVELFNGHKNRWGYYEWGIPDPSVPHRLRRVMLRRRKDQVLKELPPKTYEWIHLPIPRKLEVLLDELAGDKKAAAMLSAGDLPPFEKFSEARRLLSEYKAKQLEEWIQDRVDNEEPLLVFSAHRKPIEAFEEREGWGVIHGGVSAKKRQQIVDAFQAGNLIGVAAVISAANVGLTLTRASTVLFISTEWNPADNVQAEDRVHRIGQDAKSVVIYRAVTTHPLDQHIERLLLEKQRKIAMAIEADTVQQAREIAAASAEDLDEKRAMLEEEAYRTLLREDKTKTEAAIYARIESLGLYGRIKEEYRQLTEKQKDSIYIATRMLANVCDGAVMRDDMGFNATDTRLGRRLGNLPQSVWTPEAFVVMFHTLKKYKRQLGASLAEQIYGEA